MSTIVQTSSQVAVNCGTGGGFNSPATITLNSVVAGNSIILLTGTINFEAVSQSVQATDGTAFSTAVRSAQTSGGTRLESAQLFRHNVAAGTHVLTMSSAATSDGFSLYGWAIALEVSGLDNSTPVNVQTNNGSTNTPTSGSTGTLDQANNLVIAVLVGPNLAAAGIDAVSGYTNAALVQTNGSQIPWSVDYKIVTATTAQDVSWGTTDSAGTWYASIAAYKDYVAPSSITPPGIEARVTRRRVN